MCKVIGVIFCGGYRVYNCNVISCTIFLLILLSFPLNFKWCQKIKVDRKEVYNQRNYECQRIFSKNTSKHPNFLDALRNKDIFKGGAKWIKEVQHLISKSFKKIRISNTQGQKLDKKKVIYSAKEKQKKKRISKKFR
jgi:hypothetical protein